MAVSSRRLPSIPLDARNLCDNLKLFSDLEISQIKSALTENGRYQSYVDERGQEQELAYSVYVFDGKYFAIYPGKELLLGGESSFGKSRLAQDLDTGEWVVDKKIVVDPSKGSDFYREDVINEKNCLRDNHQAVLASGDEVVSFYRPLKTTSAENSDEDGRYEIFMKYAPGANLEEYLQDHSDLSTLEKMEISLGLVEATQNLHDHNLIHRDIKPRNVVYHALHSQKHAVKLIDFGLSVHMDELDSDLAAGWGTPGYMAPEICERDGQEVGLYGTRSDIYALGVTLGRIWNFVKIDEDGIATFNEDEDFSGDFAMKHGMTHLIRKMMHQDYLERPDLDVVLFELSRLFAFMPAIWRLMNVGFVDMHELLAASTSEEALEAFTNSLHSFDKIRLFDSRGGYFDRDYMIGMQMLEDFGCVVSDKIYQGTLSEIEEYVMLRNRQEDVNASGRIEQMQLITSAAEEERNDEVMTQDDGSYDYLDCMSWFFGNLGQDALNLGAQAVRPVQEQCAAPGCFGFFSGTRSPELARITNPLYDRSHGSEESDSDEIPSQMTMSGRY